MISHPFNQSPEFPLQCQICGCTEPMHYPNSRTYNPQEHEEEKRNTEYDEIFPAQNYEVTN